MTTLEFRDDEVFVVYEIPDGEIRMTLDTYLEIVGKTNAVSLRRGIVEWWMRQPAKAAAAGSGGS